MKKTKGLQSRPRGDKKKAGEGDMKKTKEDMKKARMRHEEARRVT